MGFIPEGWTEYTPVNKPIKGLPIVAFKTPLAERYNRSFRKEDEGIYVESDEEFTPAQLCEKMEVLGFEFAVIIDLTYTFRYYNGPQEFEQRGIQYEKIKCEGQKRPNDRVFERMAEIINDVIYENGRDSKKLVGVHCTHGVNRAGYLLSRYMIEYLGYEVDDAINAFNTSRGHDIERDTYLEDLQTRTPAKKYDEWKVKREQREKDGYELWNDNIRSFERDEPYTYHMPNNRRRQQYFERRYYHRQNIRNRRGKFYDRRRLSDLRNLRSDPWNERNTYRNGDCEEEKNMFSEDAMIDGSGFVVESFSTEQFAVEKNGMHDEGEKQ